MATPTKARAAKFAALAALTALTLSSCGGQGDGKAEVKLTAVTMVQPKVPSAPVEQWFYKELEKRSNGRIKVETSEPESLCKAQEIADCIRNGTADIGVSISDYTPQLFPTMTVVSIPFMADNSQALMQALSKVNSQNADAQAAWKKVGIELVSAWGPGKLIIGSNKRIQDIADISGTKFRVTGAFLQHAFAAAGANVVALTAGETYEGIERGLAEAIAWTMDGPVDYKMMEQLSTWADPGVGHYTTFAMWVNKGVYDKLPDDLKKIFDDVRKDLNGGEGMKLFNEQTAKQCKALKEFPKTKAFTSWSKEATEEWKQKVQADLINRWVEQAEKDGLKNARGYLEDYQKALKEAAAQPDIVQDPVVACIAQFADK